MVAVKFFPRLLREPSPRVVSEQSEFYYYIGNGDFSIVLPGVCLFVLAHLIFLYGFYEVLFISSGDKLWTHANSLIWCK